MPILIIGLPLLIISSDECMKENAEPPVRFSLADAVAEKLKILAKSGKYKSGDKLPSEPELMQQFGVGRSSIREAVRILANCGLVSVKQGLGTFVILNEGISEPLHQRLKRAGNKDLHEVRQLLELKAAEKAAENRTQKDINRMASLLKKLKASAEKGDVPVCIELDVQFHIALAEASKNEILADLYKTIAVQIKKSFQQVFEDTSLILEKQPLHEDLLQSIIDKNAKKAWKLMADITGQSVLI